MNALAAQRPRLCVVHRRDQIEVAAQAGDPAEGQAVLEQHHAQQGPPRPLLAMAGPSLAFLIRPAFCSSVFVGWPFLELGLGLDPLLEVLGVELEVAGPVLLQHPPDPVHRCRPARGAAAPAVDETLRRRPLVACPAAAANTAPISPNTSAASLKRRVR